MSKPRVIVVVNKWWELDPILFYVLSQCAGPKPLLPWPTLNEHPRPRRSRSTPEPEPATALARALFDLPAASVEIWCVSDLLAHLPDMGKWQSSTQRKAERLPTVFKGVLPSLVVAVGTAASGELPSRNGSVVVGTKVFIHNSKPNGANLDSDWRLGPFDELLGSAVDPERFNRWVQLSPLREDVTTQFFVAPQAPAPSAVLLADYDAVALANVNVTDYREYATTDCETIAAFADANLSGVLGSLETTHGVVRALGGDRFAFVSGVVNRIGHFHEDVEPRPYVQNSVGAHNAGVILAWLLSRLEAIV